MSAPAPQQIMEIWKWKWKFRFSWPGLIMIMLSLLLWLAPSSLPSFFRAFSLSLSLFLSFLFQIIFLRVSARTNAARLAHRYLSGLWKQLHIVPRTVRSRWKGKGVEVEVKVVHDFACQACISNIKNEGVDLCRRANELSWVATYNSKRNKTEEKCSANQLVFLTSPPLLFTVLLPSDFTVKLLVAFCSHDVCLFHFVDWLHCCTSYANLEWSLPCACVLIFFFLFLSYFAFLYALLSFSLYIPQYLVTRLIHLLIFKGTDFKQF